MPYQRGNRLPGEKASKIGHLEVIQSPLVKRLCDSFNSHEDVALQTSVNWSELPTEGNLLNVIFSADGSIQTIEDKKPPYKAISFIKTVLFKMDQCALDKIDKENPHPFVLRDIMKESALFHATSFPLRHVFISGKNVYHTVREILYESVKDPGLNNSIGGAMMDTLKWIAFEKWNEEKKTQLEHFGCPYCDIDKYGESHATLGYDEESGKCPNCKNEIFITDMFGLHQTMSDDFAPNQVAMDYMSIAETLMIFTPIRYYWEHRKNTLKNTLLIKDGPLSLRATLAKLSAPIRRFFLYAKSQNYYIHMIGQEKTGAFYDHLQLIGDSAPDSSYFYPDNTYIRNIIQHSNSSSIYGSDTNYGAKVFVKLNSYHKYVLNIPTGLKGEGIQNPEVSNLIGFNNIVATLPKLLSNRYEGALVPVELANGVASLSTFPSAKALELFSESSKKI